MKLELGISFFRYVSVGDIAHIGSHPPNVASVYRNSDKLFALPVGYDLVRFNSEDYVNGTTVLASFSNILNSI